MSSVRSFAGKIKRAGKRVMRSPRTRASADQLDSAARRLSLDYTPAAEETAGDSGDPEGDTGTRRLSLDGDLLTQFENKALAKLEKQKDSGSGSAPVKAKTIKLDDINIDPKKIAQNTNGFDDEDAKSDDADDGTEKHVDVRHDHLKLPVQIGGNSRAGWSKLADGSGQGGVRKANQDSYGAIAPLTDDQKDMFLSVYDGHGAEGRNVSQLVRNIIPLYAQQHYNTAKEDPQNAEAARLAALRPPGAMDKHDAMLRMSALKFAYVTAEARLRGDDCDIDHVFSGTTGVTLWVQGQTAFIAWVGDSRAIIGRSNGSQEGKSGVTAIDLTYDQKPIRSDEKKRVRAAGGRVTRWKKNIGPLRVWLPDDWIPGLAMTRSVGDTVLTEFGVIPEPEVAAFGFGPNDSFLVMASDGVWEFMTSDEVATFVAKERAAGASPSQAANRLVAESIKRWRKNEAVVDDTTAIVMYMNFVKQSQDVPDRPHLVQEDGSLAPFTPKNDDDKLDA